MMYQVLYEDGEYRPHFMCSCCQRAIKKDQPAVLCWGVNPDTPEDTGIGSIAHKGACHKYFEEGYRENGDIPMWVDLSEALPQFQNNIREGK